MSKDPKHIAELSLEEKRAILAQLLQKKMNNAENRQFNLQLAAISRPKDVPSSFAQERIWLLDQLSPGNHFYNISLTLRLDGPLYIAALEKSLNALVHRHEALRTTFTMA
ncbi:MAG TPA: condensation domain-containing protein, partial [Ktedonobacteraceae bacterium]